MIDLSTTRVSTRLAVGYGLMVFLLVLAGLWGVRTSEQAVGLLRQVTIEDQKIGATVSAIRALMETNRSQVLQTLQHNPNIEYAKWHDHPLDVHYKIATKTSQDLKRLWGQYEQGIRTPEEKQLASAWYARSRGLGIADVAKAMADVDANEWSNAQAVLIRGINPSYRDGDAAMAEVRKHYETRATENATAVDLRLATNARIMYGILGVSFALAFVLVGWQSRMLRRELGGEPGYAREVTNRIAQGNLSESVVLTSHDRGSVLCAMQAMQESLVDVVSRVRVGSDSVCTASQEISLGNKDLSARTEAQASALEQTAASMNELAATVRQNADNAALADQLAKTTSTLAAEGGGIVSQVVANMRLINESARHISDIIGVIDGIAFQTNILALNAAVEAARAGEQGRGFAVVAGEVRTLAGRTAEAAKEIKQLINASVERADQGSALVDTAGDAMNKVVDAIRRVTSVVGEISVASAEQSTGVAQVGEAITQLDHATQQNAALVEKVAAAATVLSDQARDLVNAVAVFKLVEQS